MKREGLARIDLNTKGFMGEGRPSQEKGVPIFWDALRGRIVVSGSRD
jgi:hypothetical protein